MPSQCQRPGCTRPTKGNARFCCAKEKAEDYAETRREKRKEEVALAKRLLRKHLGIGLDLETLCTCPRCDGSCKRKRGRPRGPARKKVSVSHGEDQ